MVEALARGLRLADVERDLLYRLAGLSAPGPHVIPRRIAPSLQRLLDRLAGVPVVVYDAAWNLLGANAPYDALMGDTSALHGNDLNGVWRNLLGSGSRTVQTPQEHDEQVAQLVADLRTTASRYPDDPRLRALVAQLHAASPRFADLWRTAPEPPPSEPTRHKTIEHPAVGRIAVDCDTLVVAGEDLRVMVYTAEPGTDDADRLELAIVLGTQTLVE